MCRLPTLTTLSKNLENLVGPNEGAGTRRPAVALPKAGSSTKCTADMEWTWPAFVFSAAWLESNTRCWASKPASKLGQPRRGPPRANRQ